MLRRPRPRPRHLAPLRSPSLRSAAKCAPRRATDISAIGLVLGRHFAGCSTVAGCYLSSVDIAAYIAVDTAGNNFDKLELHFLGSFLAVAHSFANCNMTGSLLAS